MVTKFESVILWQLFINDDFYNFYDLKVLGFVIKFLVTLYFIIIEITVIMHKST